MWTVVALAAAVSALADQHENCGGWAAMGECEKNPGYMLSNCQESCGGSFYDLKAMSADGSLVDFSTFKHKVVLLTNVASE